MEPIKDTNRNTLLLLLIEGYQASEEDILISKEFEQVDFENYPDFE